MSSLGANPTQLTCADVESVLPLVADGQLDPDSDPAIFLHLAECSHCQQSMARHDLISIALADAVPPADQAVIRPRFWAHAHRSWWAYAATAAVVSLGMFGAWYVFSAPAVVSPAQIVVDRVPSSDQHDAIYRITNGAETITVDLDHIDGGNDRSANRGGTSVMWRR